MNHLATRHSLRELYMMGNPSQANWSQFTSYVIAKLPQLHSLDGNEITKSMQITARQKLNVMENELKILANEKRKEKELQSSIKTAESKSINKINNENSYVEDVEIDAEKDEDENEMTENTPEARIEIYRELAQQKKEKADR